MLLLSKGWGVSGFLLVAALCVASAADYARFIYMQRHGGLLSYVHVRQFVATPLKNYSVEYDYMGALDVPCVKTMLPHQSMSPCWWVEVHSSYWKG